LLLKGIGMSHRLVVIPVVCLFLLPGGTGPRRAGAWADIRTPQSQPTSAGSTGSPTSAASAAETVEDEIRALVTRLGDPSYAVRTEATRRLCMMGQRAIPALHRAADSGEFEIALGVRNILEVLDSLYFGGCSIRLDADRTRLAWDEPIELAVSIRNESAHPAHLPLDAADRRRSDGSLEGDIGKPSQGASEKPGAVPVRGLDHATQVGDLIDLADYLHVTAPDGRDIPLRVDDVRADRDVAEAIEWRANGGSVTELAPRAQAVYRVPRFNRGWARYPLLQPGVYRVVFDYDPQWEDEEFRQAGVGRVTSNVLELTVTKPAPAIVRQFNGETRLVVEQGDGRLVARLTNTDDLPVWINLNTCGDQPPFAQIVWTVFAGERVEEVRLDRVTPAPLPEAFRLDRVMELAPGDSLELQRIALADLFNAAGQAAVAPSPPSPGSPPAGPVIIRATWVNQTDPVWQQQQEPTPLGNPRAPAALRQPLPRRMLTGRLTSDPLEFPFAPQRENDH